MSKTEVLVRQRPLAPDEYKQVILHGVLPAKGDDNDERNKWINRAPLSPEKHKAMVMGWQ